MEFFSKNRAVIFTSSYRKIKNEKKKLFLNSYTEPEFEVGTANNDLKKKLATKTDVVFADIVTTLPTKSSLNSIKHLCIMQRRLDRQLLIDVLSANCKHAFFDFMVCLQSEVVRDKTDKETIEKAWTKDFYVNLILDTDYPRLHIFYQKLLRQLILQFAFN